MNKSKINTTLYNIYKIVVSFHMDIFNKCESVWESNSAHICVCFSV